MDARADDAATPAEALDEIGVAYVCFARQNPAIYRVMYDTARDKEALPVETEGVPGYSKSAKEITLGKDGAPTEPAAAQTATYGRSIMDHLLRGTILTVGCNNLFDRDPPLVSSRTADPSVFGNGNTFPQTYDALGRLIFLNLVVKL